MFKKWSKWIFIKKLLIDDILKSVNNALKNKKLLIQIWKLMSFALKYKITDREKEIII